MENENFENEINEGDTQPSRPMNVSSMNPGSMDLGITQPDIQSASQYKGDTLPLTESFNEINTQPSRPITAEDLGLKANTEINLAEDLENKDNEVVSLYELLGQTQKMEAYSDEDLQNHLASIQSSEGNLSKVITSLALNYAKKFNASLKTKFIEGHMSFNDWLKNRRMQQSSDNQSEIPLSDQDYESLKNSKRNDVLALQGEYLGYEIQFQEKILQSINYEIAELKNEIEANKKAIRVIIENTSQRNSNSDPESEVISRPTNSDSTPKRNFLSGITNLFNGGQ